MKDAAIADPETGSAVPAIYSLQCILGAPRTVVPRKYDKFECGIDIPSLFIIELTSVVISKRFIL
jgi:hypothetical protein